MPRNFRVCGKAARLRLQLQLGDWERLGSAPTSFPSEGKTYRRRPIITTHFKGLKGGTEKSEGLQPVAAEADISRPQT